VLNSAFMIRKMTVQDLDQLMVIEHEAFSLPWSRNSYEAELQNAYANYLVCDWAGELAGYIGMWTVMEEAHLTNVAVASKFRGQGIARTLMRTQEKLARSKGASMMLLEVRPSNQPALQLYSSLGYIHAAIRKNYYSDNQEDALIMVKHLHEDNEAGINDVQVGI